MVSSLAVTPLTPLLSSPPLVAPNSTGSVIDGGAGVPPTSRAPDTPVAWSFLLSLISVSPSGFKPPSVRAAAPNASPATNQTVATHSSSGTSDHSASLAHFTASASATGTSSPKPAPSAPSSSSAKPTGSTSPAPASSKPTPSPTVSSKASTNSTTVRGSSNVTLPQAVATKPVNVTSSVLPQVNGSSTTHTFIPQVSTSDTLPFSTTSPESSPTIAFNNLTGSSGFFANRGAVAGVFVVVGLAVLGLAGLLFFVVKRYCYRRRRDSYTWQPELEPSHQNDMHYRRASQMRALGNALGTGASRPFSGHSIASEESHSFTRDTYRSTDPIVSHIPNRFPNQQTDTGLPQGSAEGYTNGHNDLNPYPPPQNRPFPNRSMQSVQSAVESSPSIYPPTLPHVIDEKEEDYWRQQGFERVGGPPESDRISEKHAPLQQLTPPESMLGLWSNASQHSSSEENELVRNLDPRMEPTSVHKGSTAPIACPPRLQLHDRYPVGGFAPPYRHLETSQLSE